ncbi:hypothetical protein UCRPA7_2845 [Phaeoacremonium minimum UCRPA7]|uniref:Uncharacterized protein n=1 Tax=Phaeoacremonium minimum (strain UCR-PA7) TaxID=1286976 RepID=R8BQM1_PHAM7|nr:hypothetical protein UCRPA7_2845 [Phaeoacremonium minimum UCRPA7]EOO01661.1 hypothetical protein UCRPA7_2845 [Phaeoacremonium minimum UCRPA7]
MATIEKGDNYVAPRIEAARRFVADLLALGLFSEEEAHGVVQGLKIQSHMNNSESDYESVSDDAVDY